jgi:hypothetical protein
LRNNAILSTSRRDLPIAWAIRVAFSQSMY